MDVEDPVGDGWERRRLVRHFHELEVYQAAFALQQDIFAVTRAFAAEEKYALTDQVRRSSRAVGAAIAEAWGKRRYEAHFRHKLSDADGELQETLHWIGTCRACGYLPATLVDEWSERAASIGRQIGRMITDAHVWVLPGPPPVPGDRSRRTRPSSSSPEAAD